MASGLPSNTRGRSCCPSPLSEALDEVTNWAIVDVRRVGHPPLTPFVVIPPPPFLDLTVLLEHVRAELPSLRPIGGAYLNDCAVSNTVQATSSAMTSVPRSTSSEQLPVPALDLNMDLLERRTALRATFNRHAGQQGISSLQAGTGGISSSSSSVTEDATDASASFHSGSIDENIPDDGEEVIPVLAASTSTTTMTMPPPLHSEATTTSTTTPPAAEPGRHAASLQSCEHCRPGVSCRHSHLCCLRRASPAAYHLEALSFTDQPW